MRPSFLDPMRFLNGGTVSTLACRYEHMSIETLVRQGVHIDVLLYHTWRAGGGKCTGYVYFIQAGEGGPIKIGWAKNVLARLSNLQIGNHMPLTMRAKFAAPMGMERALHVIFDNLWTRGEWFTPGYELTALISRIANG